MHYFSIIVISILVYITKTERENSIIIKPPPYPTDGTPIKYYYDEEVKETVEKCYGIGEDKKTEIDKLFDQIQEHTCLKFERVDNELTSIGINFYESIYDYGDEDIDEDDDNDYYKLSDDESEPTVLKLIDLSYCDISKLRFFIGLALGLIPEIQRIDRDREVEIYHNKLIRRYKPLFQKSTYYYPYLKNTDYDFASAMSFNYDVGSLKSWYQTYKTKFYPFYDRMLSVNRRFVFSDFRKLNYIYCSDKCLKFNDCEHGGYYHNGNCNTCTCPPMFSGEKCEDVTKPTTTCNKKNDFVATYEKQTYTIGNITGECYYTIKTLNSDKKVHLVIKGADLKETYNCHTLPKFEIKYRNDKGVEGVYFCRDELNITIPVSSNEVVMKLTDNNKKQGLVYFEYHQV